MQSYLVTVKYTPEVRQQLAQHPKNRLEPFISAVRTLGGEVDQGWVVLDGKYDSVLIVEMQNYTSIAALAATLSGSGTTSDVNIVPLMKISDWLDAMIRARQSQNGAQPQAPAPPQSFYQS